MAVTNPTLTASMKTVLEHIRRKDAGDGSLASITAQEAKNIATYFFSRYKDEVGMRDVEDPTNEQLAKCIFKKLRLLFKEAKFMHISKTPLETYVATLNAANAQAESDFVEELGTDQDL